MSKRETKFNPQTISRRSAAAQLRHAAAKYESRAEMSRKTGISRSTLNRYLSAQSVPTRIAKENVAKALNRIHYQPPPKPPRVKSYSRDELSKIALWATSAGSESIKSSKLSNKKIRRIVKIIETNKGTPRGLRGERIEKIRERFNKYRKANNEPKKSEIIQNAGDELRISFDQTPAGIQQLSTAWRDEMKTLMLDIRPGLEYREDKLSALNFRLENHFSTRNPMSFVQFVNYFEDWSTFPPGYFAFSVDTENGDISIFQYREQQHHKRNQSKSSHVRSREN